jgi:hypothetical protein
MYVSFSHLKVSSHIQVPLMRFQLVPALASGKFHGAALLLRAAAAPPSGTQTDLAPPSAPPVLPAPRMPLMSVMADATNSSPDLAAEYHKLRQLDSHRRNQPHSTSSGPGRRGSHAFSSEKI